MPALRGRLRAAFVALMAAILAVATLAPVTAAAPEPPGIDAFMKAMGQVESSGRYSAINPVSGAYGKYQIMPVNWPVWAGRYLDDPGAPQNSQSQEIVARARFIALHSQFSSWPRVAYWWLTGSTRPLDQWSATARRYVDKVIALAGGKGWTMAGAVPGAAQGKVTTSVAPSRSTGAPATPPPPVNLDNDDPAIAYKGAWSTAGHPAYAGGTVAWSTSRGASATVTFTGRTISWVGPAGPTRGAAQVFIDGEPVATASQFARGFTAQHTPFTRDFGARGTHSLRIVVTGTSGHPMVAIDQLVVGF